MVKLLLENLPPSLATHRETLAHCLEAMNRVMPLREVYLFGSHARGDARPDSDVDLCLVAEGAERQLKAAQAFRLAMRPIPAKPSFTLVPIAPARLAEKKASGDYFFQTVLSEGVLLVTENPADWIWMAATDLEVIQLAVDREIGFITVRGKLAEILEKVLKAELIRLGWPLEKTHDLEVLLQALTARNSDLTTQAAPRCAELAEVYFADRYPGFDLDDPDWPHLRTLVEQVAALLQTVKSRLPN